MLHSKFLLESGNRSWKIRKIICLFYQAEKKFDKPEGTSVHFVDDPQVNAFLNGLDRYPHAYVLAYLMDRQIKVERAWTIPWVVKETLDSFDIEVLGKQPLEYYQKLFTVKALHRFDTSMAKTFHATAYKIQHDLSGDASSISRGNPSSTAVVYQLLKFDGCGIKIATMTVNILARQFKIPFSDYYSIDISPDVHLFRVKERTELVSSKADRESIIYKARELNPELLGIIDFSCWEIGRNYCRSQNPKCGDCLIESECNKVGIS